MDIIQLKLELNEVNQILEALGRQPYAQVFQLINKIQVQAEQQLSVAKGQPSTVNQSDDFTTKKG